MRDGPEFAEELAHPGHTVRSVCIVGTASHEGVADLPDVVEHAVGLARSMGFELSCHVTQGRLLSVLAAGRPGGLIGETGTGCGVGLAWRLSSSDADTRLVSVEADPERVAAAGSLFADESRVTVLCDDWEAMVSHGPFDLLVLDGGGAGKARGDDRRVEPQAVLRPGGTLVMDNWVPWQVWPPAEDGEFDQSRLHWLEHPDLLATEIRLAATLSTIVATRR